MEGIIQQIPLVEVPISKTAETVIRFQIQEEWDDTEAQDIWNRIMNQFGGAEMCL